MSLIPLFLSPIAYSRCRNEGGGGGEIKTGVGEGEGGCLHREVTFSIQGLYTTAFLS